MIDTYESRRIKLFQLQHRRVKINVASTALLKLRLRLQQYLHGPILGLKKLINCGLDFRTLALASRGIVTQILYLAQKGRSVHRRDFSYFEFAEKRTGRS